MHRLVSPSLMSQAALVEHLKQQALVKHARVEAALLIDRRAFIGPDTPPSDAFADHPLPIGYGQTISAPHMHAIALELLEARLRNGSRVLDVGSGSGYLTAAMAYLVAPDGYVLGIEKVPQLASRSVASISRACAPVVSARGLQLLTPRDFRALYEGTRSGGGGAAAATPHEVPGGARVPPQQLPLIRIVPGNVLSDVLQHEPPFDAIHVGAAAEQLHQVLLDKLAPGGRMVIPVGPRHGHQVLLTVDKDEDGTVTAQQLMNVGYVPLTHPTEGPDDEDDPRGDDGR